MEIQKKDVLKNLGLNDNEIQIYLFLIQKGPQTASSLAVLSKLHRTHVYDLLESLEKKAVISYIIKENKKFFQAIEPKELTVLLGRKTEELKQDEKKLSELISELNKVAVSTIPKLTASIFQGKPAFQSLLNEIILNLKKGQEYLVLGFTQKSDETLKYFLPGFSKRRVKAGIKRRAIIDADLRNSDASNQPLQEVRFLPSGENIPMGIIIYSDKVILVIIEQDYISIKIENKKISDSFKTYFDQVWKLAKK